MRQHLVIDNVQFIKLIPIQFSFFPSSDSKTENDKNNIKQLKTKDIHIAPI